MTESEPCEGARPGPDGDPLPFHLIDPDLSRLPDDNDKRSLVLAAHRYAVSTGEDLYLDPLSGLWASTAVYLWERGTCCDNGCRHCPYVGDRLPAAHTPTPATPEDTSNDH